MCLSARLSFFSASLRRPTVFAPPLSPALIFRLFFSLAPHTAFIGRPLSSADAPVLFSDTPLLFRHTHFSRHSTPNRRHDHSQDRYYRHSSSITSPSSPRRYHRHYRQGCHHCHTHPADPADPAKSQRRLRAPTASPTQRCSCSRTAAARRFVRSTQNMFCK